MFNSNKEVRIIRIDVERLHKIGIDRVVINNFKILNFENLEKKIINNNKKCEKRIERKTDLFNLTYSVTKQNNEELYTASSLEINPNRIREGNNIYNSSVKEFKLELKSIVDILIFSGIEIDLSEAKIKEIELNTTFKKSFKELSEVLLLIGKANYKNSLGMYSFSDSNIPNQIKVDRSLYINAKINDFKKDVTGKVIKFYDKTFELKRNHKINVIEELTRVELLAGRDFYRTQMSKYNLTNSLEDLKDDILKDIFVKALKTEVETKPLKALSDIKKNLLYDFLNFKRNELIKKNERKKLKSLSKEVPEIYKETRGVFEYLDKNSWIFDYSFLQEIILEKVESKHKNDYYKQIEKKYLNKNNKEVYEKLLQAIFLR